MEMTERNDGDPGAEVEVPPPVRVDEVDAVARDERQGHGRIDGEQRARPGRGHAVTAPAVIAVAPISADTPPRAARAAARSLGTIPPSNAPAPTRRSASSAPIAVATSPATRTPG